MIFSLLLQFINHLKRWFHEKKAIAYWTLENKTLKSNHNILTGIFRETVRFLNSTCIWRYTTTWEAAGVVLFLFSMDREVAWIERYLG